MGFTIATIIEMHQVRGLQGDIPTLDGSAGLVRRLADAHPPVAILEHLRHEGQSLQASVLVERCKNFFLATNNDPFS